MTICGGTRAPSDGKRPTAVRTCFVVLSLGFALLTGCSANPIDGDTDEAAASFARDLGERTRPRSADELVRAALGDQPSESNEALIIYEAKSFAWKRPGARVARLVFRVRALPPDDGQFALGRARVACYRADFNIWGLMGRPKKVDCPAHGKPIIPAPIEPTPRVAIPLGFDAVLPGVVAGLPADASADAVRAAVVAAFPPPSADPETGLTNLNPAVDVQVRGSDLGIALWEPDDRSCLLAARIGGDVTVWRPAAVQLQPGELTCDAETALRLLGVHPPH